MSPRIFIFHFKRFNNEGRKIKDIVKYPKTFSLKNFMSSSIDQMIDGGKVKRAMDNEIFDLYGIVVHSGNSCRQGHYFSYVKNYDD